MAVNDEIPKSRITLTYRTEVEGEPVDRVLPFRVLLMGAFGAPSSVTEKQYLSADRQLDLDQRQIRNLDGKNLGQVMKDMKMSLHLKGVLNRLTGKMGGDADSLGDITLPITSMKSFTPAEIANNIPQVKAMLLLRKLLLEVQANLDNHKEFRKKVRELARPENREALAALRAEFETLQFGDFKLPQLPRGQEEQDESETVH